MGGVQKDAVPNVDNSLDIARSCLEFARANLYNRPHLQMLRTVCGRIAC